MNTLIQPSLIPGIPDEPFPPRGPKADPDAARRLADAAKADMARVAPGVHVWKPKAGAAVPDTVMCRWVPKAADGWMPVPIAGRYVRLTAALAGRLGFRDADKARRYDTLVRLSRAGFIEILHVSPGCYMLELDSWHRHLAEVSEDEEFWAEGRGNREKYFEANGLGGWKRKE
jgi:hypothetical protein